MDLEKEIRLYKNKQVMLWAFKQNDLMREDPIKLAELYTGASYEITTKREGDKVIRTLTPKEGCYQKQYPLAEVWGWELTREELRQRTRLRDPNYLLEVYGRKFETSKREVPIDYLLTKEILPESLLIVGQGKKEGKKLIFLENVEKDKYDFIKRRLGGEANLNKFIGNERERKD